MARLNQPDQLTGSIPAPLAEPVEKQPLPRLAPSPRFLLLAHPNRWCVSGGKLIPLLKRFSLEPGVGGVDKAGNYHNAIAQQEARGWTLIPEAVDGPGTSYLRVDKVQNGHRFRTRWEVCYNGSTRIGSKTEEYAEWACSLVERGIIRPAPVYAIEGMIERLETSIANLANKVHAVPSLQIKIDAQEADLVVLRAALAEIEGELQPTQGAAPAALPEPDPVDLRAAELHSSHKKAQLMELADQLGLSTKGTAKTIAQRIAEHELGSEDGQE
jgi:hypothetical protein